MLSLVSCVEDVIEKQRPLQMSIMIDEWTDHNIHFVAIFAFYISNGEYSATVLVRAPFLEEDNLSSN